MLGKTGTKLSSAQVDADNLDEVVELIRRVQPDAVLNVALPYQDLTIMEACLKCGVDYIDTANYEPESTEDPAWRALYEKRVEGGGLLRLFRLQLPVGRMRISLRRRGLTALLGTGFDPGVTSVFVSYAKKHYFDRIESVDILDCNGRRPRVSRSRPNFNPEINLREVSAPGSYWEGRQMGRNSGNEHQTRLRFSRSGQKGYVPCCTTRKSRRWRNITRRSSASDSL